MHQRAPLAHHQTVTSLADLRAGLRAAVRDSAEQTQLGLAERITVTAVRAYWNGICPSLPLASPPKEIKAPTDALAAVATQLGAVAAGFPVADAAYQLSLLYTALLPSDWRSKRGIYYTPPALANRLLDQSEAAGLNWKKARILDPAAGAGAFLVPAAERLLKSLGHCSPAFAVRNISARLRGYEIDPFAAWLGQVFVEAAILPAIAAARRRPGPFIEVVDSLTVEAGEQVFDLVIGNPPFGRVSLPEAQRERFERSLYGHANLYGLFMDLSVRLVRRGGLVSLLTPSSFLAGEYFKNLRAVLWKEAPPVELDFVSVRKGVFEDVLQETVLATYRKGARRRAAKVCFLHPQPGQAAVPEPAGQFSLPRRKSAPWLLPRHADEAALALSLRSMRARLADWGYTVSTGPLVWNRFKPQLCDRKEKGAIPLIWAESVTRDGTFVFRSEKRNHKPFFRLEEDDEWLVVRKPCVLLQRTTAKEQARRLIAAEMPAEFIAKHGGVTVENHLNMIIPVRKKPAISPLLLAAFLNSTAADRAFRCISGSVAVSAYELESLPLPSAKELKRRLGRRVDADTVEQVCMELYAGGGST